jgi:hypothetical protein
MHATRARSHHEEPNRTESPRVLGFRGGQSERRYLVNLLALGPQRLPAGGDDAHFRTGLQQSLGHRCGGVDHMLAGVQDQQQAPVRQRLRHKLGRNLPNTELEPDRSGNRCGNQAGIGDSGEFSDPHAIGKFRQQLTRGRQGKSRLTNTTGACEADEPIGGQQSQDVRKLLLPADQFGHLFRQVGRRLDRLGCRHRGHIGRLVCGS